MDGRPNILVIMSDEHAPMYSHAYGHPRIETPHMDALAAGGTLFRNAYCPSPLCVPSRAAFVAGKHVHRIGAYDNGAPFPSETVTFPHLLRAAGFTSLPWSAALAEAWFRPAPLDLTSPESALLALRSAEEQRPAAAGPTALGHNGRRKT